ncbi:GMC oxidoreductase [Athelia psychrophila]|uniref:GMC oxidoreductase n=1 Tax=Athelia psychrophila TaxID=1759441 RepID=A0A167WPL2_9AGAM|nr:GMC oxidoreductase [Fibularhizoctonia sp. CBS 109695]
MRSIILTSFLVSAVTAYPSKNITTITSDPTSIANQTYDYVIVGGGLTGLVAANKIASSGATVLVIEAGKNLQNETLINNAFDGNALSQVPGLCDWLYPIVDSGVATTTRSGKCLGGGTSINGMHWARPDPNEIDAIGELGNQGWSYAALKPFFTAIEGYINPDQQQISEGAGVLPQLHGYSGPTEASFYEPLKAPAMQRLYKTAILQVFQNLVVGPDLNQRYNGSVISSTSGSYHTPAGSNITIRSSSANAWLYPSSQQRSTLTVLVEHLVTKVDIKGPKNLSATGVEFAYFSGNASTGATPQNIMSVKVNKEVILAAGSLASPPLLERSGVGNSTLLQRFGIQTLVDLPAVGLNLFDQPGTTVSASIKNGSVASLIDSRPSLPFAPVTTWVTARQLFGDNFETIGSQLKANLSSMANDAVAAGVAVSYEAAFTHFSKIAELLIDRNVAVAEIIGESYQPNILSIIIWPSIPLSRGYVHINSTNPFDYPAVSLRYLTNDFDVAVAVAVAKAARRVHETPVMQAVIANTTLSPPAFTTDEEWADWFKATSYGSSHLLGTTPMAPQQLGGVVDARYRVYGVQNLRIIDAGTLAIELTAHASNTLYATALMGATMILEDN